jgi:hypothetical protein
LLIVVQRTEQVAEQLLMNRITHAANIRSGGPFLVSTAAG